MLLDSVLDDEDSLTASMPHHMQQVHLGVGPQGSEYVKEGSQEQTVEEHEKYQRMLLMLCPAHIWPKGSLSNACPRPILVNSYHQRILSELHDALSIALTDIVHRWWTDQSAEFPRRLPLDSREAELLKVSLSPILE